jgi:hypothetical protein
MRAILHSRHGIGVLKFSDPKEADMQRKIPNLALRYNDTAFMNEKTDYYIPVSKSRKTYRDKNNRELFEPLQLTVPNTNQTEPL